jgi:hypothetical protein
MNTIEQIQEKMIKLQEELRYAEKFMDNARSALSDLDTLMIDLKYDYQVEQFMSRRA